MSTFREIDGKPIFWQDKKGVMHQCEGSEVHPDVRLLWTLCGHDVPAGMAYHPNHEDVVTCAVCAAWQKKSRLVSGAGITFSDTQNLSPDINTLSE